MTRTLLLGLLLSLVIFGTTVSSPIYIPLFKSKSNALNDLRRAVVPVEVWDIHLNMAVGNGSGVIISSNTIITNRHVAEPGAGRYVMVDGKVPKNIILSDTADLALLVFDKPFKDKPMRIANEEPKVDTAIGAAGWPNSLSILYLTYGNVQGYDDTWMYVSAPISGGNSGGALFKKDGDEYILVGLTSQIGGMCLDFACYPVPHTGLGVRLKHIKNMLIPYWGTQ